MKKKEMEKKMFASPRPPIHCSKFSLFYFCLLVSVFLPC